MIISISMKPYMYIKVKSLKVHGSNQTPTHMETTHKNNLKAIQEVCIACKIVLRHTFLCAICTLYFLEYAHYNYKFSKNLSHIQGAYTHTSYSAKSIITHSENNLINRLLNYFKVCLRSILNIVNSQCRSGCKTKSSVAVDQKINPIRSAIGVESFTNLPQNAALLQVQILWHSINILCIQL